MNDLERALVDSARTGARLTCDDTRIGDSRGLIRAQLLRELLLGRRGPVDPRGIRIAGVRIVGVLDLDNVVACAGAAMTECLFAESFTAWNARLPWLDLSLSRLPGFCGGLINVEAGLWFTGTVVHGSRENGAIELHGASIRGTLDLQEAKVFNETGPAVWAAGLEVGGNFRMSGADLIGAGRRGTVHLLGAHIGGIVTMASAKVINGSGKAIFAGQARIGGNFNLQGVNAFGNDDLGGAISLLGAHIDGDVNFLNIEVANRSGLALDLERAKVAGKVLLVRSALCSEPDADGRCKDPTFVDLNGFTFDALEALPGEPVSWWDWLHLIRHHTDYYRPGPYQALASVERDAGHDGNVRKILVAQQKDIRQRAPEALGSWSTRCFHWLWGALAGYGYRAPANRGGFACHSDSGRRARSVGWAGRRRRAPYRGTSELL